MASDMEIYEWASDSGATLYRVRLVDREQETCVAEWKPAGSEEWRLEPEGGGGPAWQLRRLAARVAEHAEERRVLENLLHTLSKEAAQTASGLRARILDLEAGLEKLLSVAQTWGIPYGTAEEAARALRGAGPGKGAPHGE